MFEIEVPEAFIVRECKLCCTRHALIRECPDTDVTESNLTATENNQE